MKQSITVRPVDKSPGTVAVPEDLKSALLLSSAAEQAFTKLPPSHQKEFMDWIVSAKKPETRARRVAKALEMLVTDKRSKG
jgi:uncharacterized protein YdeI (YjbR/CyaY-like superfamily)